ncbi:MAG TPA: ZIP family zinc transporter [Deltaproteobacteria bacterium]|mgnify:CR=1 FL=1|jgi:ZIP family zinc transporter|nr:ZIP family zinc transporter [Deltaproteobacteria bacterium]HOI08387.1 ZIP family zinc transporter [Deltaproteobacteria bacterium]
MITSVQLAGIWGFAAGSALLIGALTAWFLRVPERVTAALMSFSCGALLSALAFELMGKAYQDAGLDTPAMGFITGMTVYTVANFFLSYRGARHRKRSSRFQPSEAQERGSGLAIAAGSLMDGIPEAVVIGLSMTSGAMVSLVVFFAIFASNIPEGLSSVAGMREAGRSPWYVFGVWVFIAVATAFIAMGAYWYFRELSPQAIAAATAMSAGAILAMMADTMLPEAFSEEYDFAGFITALGFLVSFVLTSMGV